MLLKRQFAWIAGGLTILSLACSAGGLFSAAETSVPTATQPLYAATLAHAATASPAGSTPVSEPSPLPGSPTTTENAAAMEPMAVTAAEPTLDPNGTPSLEPSAAGLLPSPSPLQFNVFEEVWGAVQQNYLYTDFNGLDWDAVRQEMLQKIGAGMSDEAFYQALAEMIHDLGDEHSAFFSPEGARELDLEYAGDFQYVGIGVIHSPIPERKLLSIVLVFPGSPAEQAGLKAHDNILAVDGQAVFAEDGSRLNILRGPEGTTITVTVQTPGGAPREVRITRRAVLSETPIPHQVITTPGGKRIGYLLIQTFLEEQIDERTGQALREMAAGGPLDGLIIDNRHNGGGTSEVMLNTLAYFTTGDVGLFVQRDAQETIRVNGVNAGGSQSLPLAVLVGKNTASFGEVFSGILKDLGRVQVIGERSTGNVELLRVFDFSDGSRAWIAQATFRPLNHPEQVWEGTGIVPDLSVISQWDEVTFENDPVIQAALKALAP